MRRSWDEGEVCSHILGCILVHSCIHLFLGNQESTCWGHLNLRVLLTLGYLPWLQ